jgi:WD40 repeat protein
VSITYIAPSSGAIVDETSWDVFSNGTLLGWSLNPNNYWLAATYQTEQEDRLILINLFTNETRQIKTNYPYIMGYVTWSKDGQYLAVGSYLDSEQQDLSIYSLEEDILRVVDTHMGVVSWFQSLSKFAVEQYFCIERDCQLLIKVFNNENLELEATIDVWNSIPERYRAGPATCLLNPSPDGRYIVFMFSCDRTMPDIPGELYVWDTQTNEVEQLTVAATTMRDALELGTLKGEYGTYWVDVETLLVGVYVSSVKTVVAQTLEVRFPEMSQTVISDQSVQTWLPNPVTNELAIRSFDATEPQKLPQISSLHVDMYSASTQLDLSTPSLGEGCDMAWSPDGSYLAFTRRGDLYCGLPIQAIQFYDNTTKQVSEFALPEYDPTVTRVIPLGWVEVGTGQQ